MPSGTSDSKLTNKTEFMRYMDAHPEHMKAFTPRLREYLSLCPEGKAFGFWLRQKYLREFVAAYKGHWLKHPELYGDVYQPNLLSV